jgi:hypothetical protein
MRSSRIHEKYLFSTDMRYEPKMPHKLGMVGYEELLRPRFVIFAEANNTN